MKVIPDFEAELKAIDKRLDIVPNPHRMPNEENRTGISNIKLDGQDVCPIPSDDIFDEPNLNFGYTFPNGLKARFKTRPEALGEVQRILGIITTQEGSDMFHGKGEYDTKK